MRFFGHKGNMLLSIGNAHIGKSVAESVFNGKTSLRSGKIGCASTKKVMNSFVLSSACTIFVG